MAQAAAARPPAGQGFVLIAMLFMLLITFDPDARASLGGAMSVVLTPTLGLGGQFLIITMMLAGLLTGVVSTGLRHWVSDYVAMERARLLQRSFSARMNDARLKNDVDAMAKLRKAQPQILAQTMELQAATMRPTIVTMFLALSVFWWLSIFLDPNHGLVRVQAVSLPWAAAWPLHATLAGFPYWFALYSVMSLPFTLALGATLKLWRYRSFDVEAPLKPMPTVEEILEGVEDGEKDEATIDREVVRAKKRLKGAARGAVTERPEDEVAIVDEEEASIEEAGEEDVTIVEPKATGAKPDGPSEDE